MEYKKENLIYRVIIQKYKDKELIEDELATFDTFPINISTFAAQYQGLSKLKFQRSNQSLKTLISSKQGGEVEFHERILFDKRIWEDIIVINNG